MTNNISEDLIVEIFTRLPTKSLLRFRSVSKSLCACIGSRNFVRLHTLRSPKKFIMIHEGEAHSKDRYTIHSEDHWPYKPYPYNPDPYNGVTPVEYPFKNFKTVGSCNGILCVYKYGKGIYLWNPSIRRKVTIHDLPFWSRGSKVIGFGFDPIIDDYKILGTSKACTFVYTMKTRTWREITSPAFLVSKSYQCEVNGALHWVAKLTNSINVFDLSSEVFSTIELPKTCWETCRLTIIKGCLALISSEYNRSCIWVIRRENNNTDASSWSIALEFDYNPFAEAKRVFQCSINGNFLVNKLKKTIIVYNYNKQVLCSRILENLSGSSCIVDMNACIESLELLDMGTSYDQETKLVYGPTLTIRLVLYNTLL